MAVLPEDPKERKRVTILIIFSCLTLAAAITISVLFTVMVDKIEEYYEHNDELDTHRPAKWYGSGFFTAFLFAIISAFARNKCMHIFSAVVSVIVLLANGLLFVALIMIWSEFADETDVYGELDKQVTEYIVVYGKALTAVVAMGWFFNLVTCICNFLLMSKQEPGAVVIHQGPTTTVMTSYPTGTAYVTQGGAYPTSTVIHQAHAYPIGAVEGATGFSNLERPPPYDQYGQPRMTTSDRAKLTQFSM